MKSMKAISYVLAMVTCMSIVLLFQNCGGDVKSKTSSNGNAGGGLQVEPPPVSPTDPNPPTPQAKSCAAADRASPFSFDIGCDDAFMYQAGTGQTGSFDAIKYTLKDAGTLETVEVSGMASAVDLPAAYCQNSALPHCRHINGKGCQGEACVPGNPSPAVLCNSENIPSAAELTSFYGLINGLAILNNPNDQLIADCDTPNFRFFSSELADIDVSLSSQSCVPKGKLYTNAGSAAMILEAGNKIAAVKAKGEFCNSYALQNSFEDAKFSYKAYSGFVVAGQNYSRVFDYIAKQKVNMKYKNAGDPVEYCVSNFHVNPAEMYAFFPQAGLNYKVHKTPVALADAPTAEIQYSEPALGTDVMRFFLDTATAETHMGGAVIDAAQAAAMKAAVESLITQAEAANLSAACP